MIESLLVARPKGIIDYKAAEDIVEFVEVKEVRWEEGFNRFCDFTRLEGIQLSRADVFLLACRRRAFNPNDFRVKSAFWAVDPLAIGIARMYEQLLDSPRIEVRVWRELEAAADWLGVNPHKLALNI